MYKIITYGFVFVKCAYKTDSKIMQNIHNKYELLIFDALQLF